MQAPIEASSAPRYRIWSFEHKAWWGPNRCGYTRNISLAGVYGEREAWAIVFNANTAGAAHEMLVPLFADTPYAVCRELCEGRLDG